MARAHPNGLAEVPQPIINFHIVKQSGSCLYITYISAALNNLVS